MAKSNRTVEQCMTADPVCLETTSTITDAACAMKENDIGDVIVTSGDRACGIVTDRDIVVRAIASDCDPHTTQLSSIVSGDLVCASPGDSLQDVVAKMRDQKIRRVPVVEDGGRPVGILSIGDLAQTLDVDSALADISAAPPQE